MESTSPTNAPTFDGLTWRDAAHIAAQRARVLWAMPIVGTRPSAAAWVRGLSWPLLFEAWLRKRAIFSEAIDLAQAEFNDIVSAVPDLSPKRMADIGCGHGLIDAFFIRRYGCEVELVDIQRGKGPRGGFSDHHAGYGSLASAKTFLLANGADEGRISCIDASLDDWNSTDCDLVISLLACGFHFPLTVYLERVLSALKPGGCFIFDLRDDSDQDEAIAAFSRIVEVPGPSYPGRKRIAGFK